jgi:hypothetical protein
MDHKIRQPRGRPVSPVMRARLRRLVDAVGLHEAAALLDLSASALRNALAELDVLRATALALHVGLDRIESRRSNPPPSAA